MWEWVLSSYQKPWGAVWGPGDGVGNTKPRFFVTEESQCFQRLSSSTSWDYSIIILPFLRVKKSKTFINGLSELLGSL